MTTTQKIEASREARLWLGTIIAPVMGYLLIDPEIREGLKTAIKKRCEQVQDGVRHIVGKLKREP